MTFNSWNKADMRAATSTDLRAYRQQLIERAQVAFRVNNRRDHDHYERLAARVAVAFRVNNRRDHRREREMSDPQGRRIANLETILDTLRSDCELKDKDRDRLRAEVAMLREALADMETARAAGLDLPWGTVRAALAKVQP